MAEHISRKELKQDKIRESIEHGAEAFYSHSKAVAVIVALALVVAVTYAGWKFYSDRQNLKASAALDAAMKVFNAPIRTGNQPVESSEPSYSTESARAEDASQKFIALADKYPRTNPGKLARYYAALCLEDLDRQNQALEELKKLDAGSDKELAAMAQYQMANIYARTGKVDEATKTYRALAEANSVFVPKPMVLLELADLLRQTKPQEAASLYEQLKKDYPNTTVADRAERGLNMMPTAPKS